MFTFLLLLLLVVQERLNYVSGGFLLTFLGSHFKSEFSALFQYKFTLPAGLTIYTTALKGKDSHTLCKEIFITLFM